MSHRPLRPETATGLTRLAAVARGLGDAPWHDQLVGWGAQEAEEDAPPPTYEQVALRGVDAVNGLVASGRWDEAFAVADRITRVFRLNRHHLHPVAAESFDGLRAAVAARDVDEVTDFAELLGELFGAADG